MEQAEKHRLSLTEYNQLEEENSLRYEYHDGEVFAMAGGDPKHGIIASNILGMLHNALLSKDCTVCNSDVKFYISSANKSLYPDVSVVCGTAERSKQDIRALTNPILLIEVLSGSTVAYDKGAKFRYYSELPSLREYVLVEQDAWVVEIRYRDSPDERWQMEWFSGKNAEVILRSINVTLPIAELYRRTEGL